jgi:hypothetical protein
MTAALKDYRQVQQIDRGEIRLLWHWDFWDGPISGLCLYDHEKYWFEMCWEGETSRRFVIRRLSPEQLADALKWHELFREKVGTHCDYDETRPQVKPKESHREFYEAYEKRGKLDFSNAPVLGWFEM